MKNMFLLGFVLLILSACSVSQRDVNHMRTRIASQEEQIAILEAQIQMLDFENARLISQQDHTQDFAPATQTPSWEIENSQRQQQEQQTPIVVNVPSGLSDFDINALYNEGRRHYESRDFAAAIRAFTVISTQAPRHELAANSVYWTGESFYALADFSAARLSFQRIQDNYPTSNKFIDAQVKIAMTWIRQNRRDLARTILEAIKRDFPNYERMNVVDQNLRLVR